MQNGFFDFSTAFRIGIIYTPSVSLIFATARVYRFHQFPEYMGGGDLLNLLIKRDIFEEDFTRFYVAEAGWDPRFGYERAQSERF